MTRKQTVGQQGPASVDSAGSGANSPADMGEQASDLGGGQPGHGQRGGGLKTPRAKDKAPKAIIAGKDGPQTGGRERGNPGVGG